MPAASLKEDNPARAKLIEDASLARSVHEAVALVSARTGDVAAFDRAAIQLKPYYLEFRHLFQDSSSRELILGLYLLSLLSASNFAQFHTELELLSDTDRSLKVISAVSELERLLMEGSYHRALALERSIASPHLTAHFFQALRSSARDRVAAATEIAYDKYPVKKLSQLLLFSDENESKQFAHERGWTESEDGVYITFPQEAEGSSTIDPRETVTTLLNSTTQLERIV